MALADGIASLCDRVLADLNAAHDYYSDTKIAWDTVEYDHQPYDKGKMSGPTCVTTFLEHAQAPNGLWYPTHYHNRCDNHIVFLPGKTLDAKWFGDPTHRFTSQTP